MEKFMFLMLDYSSEDHGEFTIIQAESEKQAVFQLLEYFDGSQPDYIKNAIVGANSLEDSLLLFNTFREDGENVSTIINLSNSNIIYYSK